MTRDGQAGIPVERSEGAHESVWSFRWDHAARVEEADGAVLRLRAVVNFEQEAGSVCATPSKPMVAMRAAKSREGDSTQCAA